MKILILSLSFTFIFCSCRAKNINELALQAAQELLNATKNNDWEKVVDYTCPLKVQELGGKRKMIEDQKEFFPQKKNRSKIKLGKIEEIQTINGTTYVRLYYEVYDDHSVNNMRIDTIGVSKDKGLTWWFIDGPLKAEQFKKYLRLAE